MSTLHQRNRALGPTSQGHNSRSLATFAQTTRPRESSQTMTLDHLNSDDSAHMQHTSPKVVSFHKKNKQKTFIISQPSRTAHRQRQHKRPKLMQSSSELLPNQEADPSSSLGEFTPTNSITGCGLFSNIPLPSLYVLYTKQV
jgi:hypothetical protein